MKARHLPKGPEHADQREDALKEADPLAIDQLPRGAIQDVDRIHKVVGRILMFGDPQQLVQAGDGPACGSRRGGRALIHAAPAHQLPDQDQSDRDTKEGGEPEHNSSRREPHPS
ncbi:MAG: hypothetical protein CMJ94_00500 [Planctomycetes bacterium]|nr:hypothetical protein [Planctomycetota bacterium]